jgi:DNA-binding transcriptional ArsR family regulator
MKIIVPPFLLQQGHQVLLVVAQYRLVAQASPAEVTACGRSIPSVDKDQKATMALFISPGERTEHLKRLITMRRTLALDHQHRWNTMSSGGFTRSNKGPCLDHWRQEVCVRQRYYVCSSDLPPSTISYHLSLLSLKSKRWPSEQGLRRQHTMIWKPALRHSHGGIVAA